ncbi:MAG: hypothetical protein L0387_33575 [Acidobacteria bacterium]|nr:hypothetical protein [Acidobacteriota bacterium]
MAEQSRQSTFLISAVDRLGRRIDPGVLAEVEQLGPRAIQYGEKLLRDPALAISLLEESAATVSRVIRIKRNDGSGISNLGAYIFRAFVRLVNKTRRKDLLLCNQAALTAGSLRKPIGGSEDLELKIFLTEFLSRCDPVTRDMFYRRMQGFSWKEIAGVHGISPHAAESKFSQALRRVRKKLGLDQ